MRDCHPTPLSCKRRIVLLALGIVLCGNMSLFAQAAVDEPVEQLRLILRAPLSDPGRRDWDLKERIGALEGLGDLRRALVLREWRDEDQDQRVAAIDRPNRLALARRFEQAVREVLRQSDEACRLAVLNMLAEMGTTVHGVGTRHGIARGFGPDLVELTKQGEANLCAAGLRTLGQIDPEPDVALSAFSGPLSGADTSQRLAASDGLACWMQTMAQLAMRDSNPNGVEVSRADLVTVGRAIVPLAARGLRAEELEIRRRSAQAIGYAATTAHNWVLTACSPEASEDLDGSQRRRGEESAELLPLILALEEQRPALTHALVDADADVRFLVGRALEEMTIPREMLMQDATRPVHSTGVRKTALVPPSEVVWPSSFIPNSSSPKEVEGLSSTVQTLAAQLTGAEVEARRAALETLETLGPDADPAIAELVGALGDQDKFVRWAAARTLGRIGPMEEEAVVPALARLLTDADLDVRLAAAAALERLASAAKAAAPDLRRTVGSTDAELRFAAIRALAAIGGPDAQAAVPELTAAVADADVRVRQVAAQVLGKFGPAAKDAVPALRQALQDESADVQRAAGEALLNILRPS